MGSDRPYGCPAGAINHVGQQALSAAVARLERSIGERLFERGGRGVELTLAGARLLPGARDLLRLADETLEAVREAPAERPGALRVGLVTPAAAELTSPILRTFRPDEPRPPPAAPARHLRPRR